MRISTTNRFDRKIILNIGEVVSGVQAKLASDKAGDMLGSLKKMF